MYQLYCKLLRKLNNNKKYNAQSYGTMGGFSLQDCSRQQTTTDQQTADELDFRERF